ncbi:MAG: hypothetical protein ACJAVH_002076 [Bacteroidia bacterium]|jgi:hypothetical protein
MDCGAFSTDSICVNITGLEDELESDEITIYPNPTSDIISITGDGLPQNPFSIRLENPSGQILLEEQYPVFGISGSIKVNMSALPTGVYFLHINGREKQLINKVVKR